MIVAIDGPAGSGKSTVARALAQRLGFRYLDTGAMYRCVALASVRAGVDLCDDAAVGSIAHGLSVVFDYGDGSMEPARVILDGEDVTTDIRTPQIDVAVSHVAKLPSVRNEMVARQRIAGALDDLVAEGRDIGTVVFPDAEVKVFLTAALEERSRRRHIELCARGEVIEINAVHKGLAVRDEVDSNRHTSPLAMASDAIVIDTTELSVDEVVERISELVSVLR